MKIKIILVAGIFVLCSCNSNADNAEKSNKRVRMFGQKLKTNNIERIENFKKFFDILRGEKKKKEIENKSKK